MTVLQEVEQQVERQAESKLQEVLAPKRAQTLMRTSMSMRKRLNMKRPNELESCF
jgi:hypothetical protein